MSPTACSTRVKTSNFSLESIFAGVGLELKAPGLGHAADGHALASYGSKSKSFYKSTSSIDRSQRTELWASAD